MKTWVVVTGIIILGVVGVSITTWYYDGITEVPFAIFGMIILLSLGFSIWFIASKIKAKVKPKIGP